LEHREHKGRDHPAQPPDPENRRTAGRPALRSEVEALIFRWGALSHWPRIGDYKKLRGQERFIVFRWNFQQQQLLLRYQVKIHRKTEPRSVFGAMLINPCRNLGDKNPCSSILM
jgi:hypothetical protein